MKLFLYLFAFLFLFVIGSLAFIWSGLYDISATDQHLAPTYYAIKKTMERSVARRAQDIPVPPLGAPAQLERGLSLFRAHCVQCHGAPGVAPEPFALGMTPLPTPLVRSGRDRSPGHLFWVVKEGIKMTGMPAWKFRMTDDDTWAVVAALKHLPKMSPRDYRALPDAQMKREDPDIPAVADAERGRQALQQYGCVGCHRIPGMVGPEARVGPTLHGIGSRLMLGGILPNSPENMARWLRVPQEVSPLTAMPNLGVTERDARDMAAYLATLK
jgi:mono/diheme cytochrome c family protein